jgi:hypothetical protein
MKEALLGMHTEFLVEESLGKWPLERSRSSREYNVRK